MVVVLVLTEEEKDEYMSQPQDKSQLNTFSTIVSILAVVVSIMITLGGYFATTATTIEKINRIENDLPQIQTKLESITVSLHKQELTLSELKANQRLNESQVATSISSLKEEDGDLDEDIKKIISDLETVKDELRRLRNILRN